MFEAPFETWLARATCGLAPDGVERIRAEIGEHYQFTIASGSTPEQAIAALGDPAQANRDYRDVFLTELEARVAARTGAKAGARPSWYFLAFAAVFVLPSLISTNNRWYLWIWAPMVALDLVRYFFPASTPFRTRLYGVAGVLFFPWMAWQWYIHDALRPFFGGMVVLAGLLLYGGALNRRIKRKLAGKPAPSLRPPPHGLTRFQELSLSRMRNRGPSRFLDPILTMGLFAVGSWFQPVVGVPGLLLMIVRFLLPEFVPIDTPERSHRFRLLRWTLFAIAALVPILYGTAVTWEPRSNFPPFLAFILLSAGLYGVLLAGVMSEIQRVSLRRKLPVAEWPKELYL